MKLNLNRGEALNLDVLLNIMSLSDMCTTSRLMRASRELYPEGPKYLLRDSAGLCNTAHIPSFVAFMRADYPHRLHLLDSLYISTGRVPKADARLLQHFVADCAPLLELRRLAINHAEEFFESTRGMARAFGLLRGVMELTLSEVGPRTSIFLRSSRSRLVFADLAMIPLPFEEDGQSLARDGDEVGDDHDEDGDDPYEGDDEDEYDDDAYINYEDWDESDDEEDNDDAEEDSGDDSEPEAEDFGNPILQLHSSQATLQLLKVRACDTFSDTGALYTHVYPHVRVLTLEANEPPAAAHYARAFPNLDTLTLRCDVRELDPLGKDLQVWHAFRVANQRHLRAGAAWPALRVVHGALVDHFLLGLARPVEQVHIEGCYMNIIMFRAVVRATRPAYVNLDAFDVDLFRDGAFALLMRGPLLAPVRCFEIMVAFGGVVEPAQVDVPNALDALIEGVGKMPSLRSFGLTLNCLGLQPDGEMLRVVARPGKLCPAEEHLRNLDLDALALRICNAVPGLQTVAVSLIGHRARPNALASLGEDVRYEEDAVERLPLWHAARVVAFKLTTKSGSIHPPLA
ncbi:hypothetical protein VTO73DRAFT_13830 [Trametes versicolor]